MEKPLNNQARDLVFNYDLNILIEIIDVLGRKSRKLKNQPLFYIYDDGSVEKKIIIE